MITVVHHSALSPPGRFLPALERAGQVVNHVLLHRGERLPHGPTAVIVLGGEMGAYEEGRHPMLRDEKRWLRGLVDAGTPVLGICLGAQVLADALGGSAFQADKPEVGVIDLQLTPAGAADPVIGGLVSPVLSVHRDSFELPGDAVLLAHSDHFPHAFRLGSAVGVQFHPEIPSDVAIGWARAGLSELFRAAGVSFEDFATDVIAHDAHFEREAATLVERWLGQALGT